MINIVINLLLQTGGGTGVGKLPDGVPAARESQSTLLSGGFSRTLTSKNRTVEHALAGRPVDIGPDGRAGPTLKKFKNGETGARMRGRVCRC
ncbi:hypothetical protein [Massilia rubra]|uniref:Uncharacterized protein n=1 Tax=Massilia rubra TaxID=2607910 RepID=A0ABX0LN22_9BURK|nr:hypothetical protein [Massilia rubra]NHZ33810.1 hypothetical protein [Massilia rubra]